MFIVETRWYFHFFILCVWMCEDVRVHGFKCLDAGKYACVTSGAFLGYCPVCALRHGLPFELEITDVPGYLHFPNSGLTSVHYYGQLFKWVPGIELRSSCLYASTSPTELSIQNPEQV